LNKAKELLAKADIVQIIGSYIEITPKGDDYRAVCPFHRDSDPSLSISPKRGIYKCFGCGAGGNVANFIGRYEGIEYYDALALLATKLGVPGWAEELKAKEFTNIFELNNFVKELYYDVLFNDTPLSKAARQFLRERRITQETAKFFNVGYAPNTWQWLSDKSLNQEDLKDGGLITLSDAGIVRDFFKNRIIFPIFHLTNLVGFTGRTLGTSKKIPKYLNSKDSPWFKKNEIIYGWEQNKGSVRRSKHAVIVEGQFDVLQLWQQGIKNTLAVSGSYFGPAPASFLAKQIKKATIFSDGDEAGVNASIRVASLLIERDVDINIIYLEGKDPDDAAKYKHRFDWDKLNTKYSSTFGAFMFKHKGIEFTVERLPYISNKIKLSEAIKELSHLSGYEEKNIDYWIRQHKKGGIVPVVTHSQENITLQEELLILATINNPDKYINAFLSRHLQAEGVDLEAVREPGAAQELASSARFANRLLTLDALEDKEQYTKDLIIRLNLKYLESDIREFKKALRETSDATYLEKIQYHLKQINKLKLRLKHGKNYENKRNKVQ